jgi:hypothetical protein
LFSLFVLSSFTGGVFLLKDLWSWGRRWKGVVVAAQEDMVMGSCMRRWKELVGAAQEDVAMGCCMRRQKALDNSPFFAST